MRRRADFEDRLPIFGAKMSCDDVVGTACSRFEFRHGTLAAVLFRHVVPSRVGMEQKVFYSRSSLGESERIARFAQDDGRILLVEPIELLCHVAGQQVQIRVLMAELIPSTTVKPHDPRFDAGMK